MKVYLRKITRLGRITQYWAAIWGGLFEDDQTGGTVVGHRLRALSISLVVRPRVVAL